MKSAVQIIERCQLSAFFVGCPLLRCTVRSVLYCTVYCSLDQQYSVLSSVLCTVVVPLARRHGFGVTEECGSEPIAN